MKLPSASLLYDMRITVDMASMLFARETIFSKAAEAENPWVVHIRTDASPFLSQCLML